MESNKLANVIGTFLTEYHPRIYRQKAPTVKDFPYIVYRLESVVNSYPSEDLYLNVDIYEDPNKSVKAVEQLADDIDKELNHSVIIENGMNLHFEREARQSIDSTELLGAYLVNLRYVVRAYFMEV